MSSDDFDYDPTPYILNVKNKYITMKYIENMLKKYNVHLKVKHLDVFQNAMTHISYLRRDSEDYKRKKIKRPVIKELEPIEYPKDAIPLQNKSYERLEFLGDSIIHAILADYLYHRYENQDEGFMTRLRTKIENGITLSLLAKCIGLNKYILISRHIEDNNGRQDNHHILEDSFEAFIGALYNESGYDNCKKFIVTLMETNVDFAMLLHTETNYKDMLLQFFHKKRWKDPKYGVKDISGPEHKKNYTMYVKRYIDNRDNGKIYGYGVSTSKKKGEQEAARQALLEFGIIKEDDDSSTEEEIYDDELEELHKLELDEESDSDDELIEIKDIDEIDEISDSSSD